MVRPSVSGMIYQSAIPLSFTLQVLRASRFSSSILVSRESLWRNLASIVNRSVDDDAFHSSDNADVLFSCLLQRTNAKFRGSSKYASVHALREQDQSRRDDLWSLLYVLVELVEGELPWTRVRSLAQLFVTLICLSQSIYHRIAVTFEMKGSNKLPKKILPGGRMSAFWTPASSGIPSLHRCVN